MHFSIPSLKTIEKYFDKLLLVSVMHLPKNTGYLCLKISNHAHASNRRFPASA